MSPQETQSGWRRVRFGGLVRQVRDIVDPESSGVGRYVAGEHMETDNLRIRRWGEVGDGYLGPAFHMRFKPGQVLYGSRRTYLRKVAVADFVGICANTTFVLEPRSQDLLPEFLPYLMTTQAFHSYSISQSKGSVNPYINFSDLTRYEFDLPPVEEQLRILELLSGFARLSNQLDLAIEMTRRQATAMRALWFADAQSGESARLGDLAVIPPQNGITVPKGDRRGEVALVNMGDIFTRRDVIHPRGVEHVTIPPDRLARYRLESGDLLFARRSVVLEGSGHCVIVSNPEDLPAVFESSVLRVRLDETRVGAEYVLNYLRSPQGVRSIRAITRRGAVSGVTGSDLRDLQIPIADLATQQQAVADLRRLRILEDTLETHSRATRALARLAHESLLGGT